MKHLFMLWLVIVAALFGQTGSVLASTLRDQVPWGDKNNYHAFDGTDFNSAYFKVGFPDLGPNVDIYAGTGGTSTSGPPYQNDPTAYYTGIFDGQQTTFRVNIANNSGTNGSDNFWFTVSKVLSCPDLDINTPLTENQLNDCSKGASWSNQKQVFYAPWGHMAGCPTGINNIDNKDCLGISNGTNINREYTWTLVSQDNTTPAGPGYYQFDFNSDDYGADENYAVNGGGSTTYAAGFLRIMPPIAGKVTSSGQGVPGVKIEVFNSRLNQTRSVVTAADGSWSIPNFVSGTDSYAVRIASIPAGYLSPAKTTATTYALNTIDSGNQPVNSASYEAQQAGNQDCAGGDASNLFGRCSFTLDSSSPSTPSPSAPNPSASPSAPAITSPSITSLQIGNAGGQAQVMPTTFTGNSRTSGLTSDPDEGGSNWLNPMSIKLNATKGTGDIKLYATAFYDKKQGGVIDQPALSGLTAIEGQINTNPARGFLLAYASQDCANQTGNCLVDNTGTGFTAGKYYAYVKDSGWVDISNKTLSNPYSVKNSSDQTIYEVYPIDKGAYYASWGVKMLSLFGSKSMYTPGFVIDSNNLTDFQNDL